MREQLLRTEMLIGADAVKKLAECRVAVFGLGGVGSYAVEALARSGIGAIDLIDNDVIALSNLNRQIYALHSTLGKFKTDVAEERIKDINPEIKVKKFNVFFTAENKSLFNFENYDYVLDAIDTVSGKIALVECAVAAGVPIISSMGTGNKLDPTALEVSDIYKTSVCPLARVMRRELKQRGIERLKVVYSKEIPKNRVGAADTENTTERQPPASIAFVPSVAGLILAGEIIKDLTGVK